MFLVLIIFKNDFFLLNLFQFLDQIIIWQKISSFYDKLFQVMVNLVLFVFINSIFFGIVITLQIYTLKLIATYLVNKLTYN